MRNIYTIALNTFREAIRSRILYAIIFFMVVIVAVSSLFGSVSIGDQAKVIKDFGLFSISFFAVAYAVISGAAFLDKELKRKTIYNILSRPVRRSEFIIGKYAGMLATVSCLILLMGTCLSVYLLFLEGRFSLEMTTAYYHIFLQLAVVCAATMFFSTIVVTPVLSGSFAFGLFIAGRSTEYLLYFIENDLVQGVSESLVKIIYYILPHLDKIDVSNQVVYRTVLLDSFSLWSTLYTIGYSGVLIALAVLIFKKTEFNQ